MLFRSCRTNRGRGSGRLPFVKRTLPAASSMRRTTQRRQIIQAGLAGRSTLRAHMQVAGIPAAPSRDARELRIRGVPAVDFVRHALACFHNRTCAASAEDDGRAALDGPFVFRMAAMCSSMTKSWRRARADLSHARSGKGGRTANLQRNARIRITYARYALTSVKGTIGRCVDDALAHAEERKAVRWRRR